MKRLAICLAAALVAAVVLSPVPAWAQTETRVTGGARGVFPNGTTYNDVPLEGLKFGMGVIISADASARGQFQATLLGTLASIEINGRVSAGSVGPGATATFSGTCSLDWEMGNLRSRTYPSRSRSPSTPKDRERWGFSSARPTCPTPPSTKEA